MKTLVIVGHPDLENSVINKKWIQELEKHPNDITVHSLCKEYPDWKINVKKEQELVEQHDNLILQFPLHWFSYPALLKKWIDEVFTYGWAYGSKGDKLKNRKIALAVSAGIKEEEFQKNGTYGATFEELILPFKITALYTKSDFKGFYILYDSDNAPNSDALIRSSQEYISFIKTL